jgi:predicted ATPase
MEKHGIEQMQRGLELFRNSGTKLMRPYWLAQLAEACRKMGQTEEGLNTVSEALTLVDETGERVWEAELYRLKGELTLQQENQKAKVKGQKSKIPNTQHPTPRT